MMIEKENAQYSSQAGQMLKTIQGWRNVGL
jgi:hypothetical protein